MSKKCSESWEISREDLEKIIRVSWCYRDVLAKMGIGVVGGWHIKTLKNKIAQFGLDCSHFVPYKKRSQDWSISKENLAKVVQESYSYKEVLEKIGVCPNQVGYRNLRERTDAWRLDCSHFHKPAHAMIQYMRNKEAPLESVLVENSQYNRACLKKRLMCNGMLKNQCGVCGREPRWEGKDLVLILDHINGVNNDNRIENLRLVCPNCESQLDTHAGKNLSRVADKICPGCGKRVSRYKTSGWCRNCVPREKRIPSKKEVRRELKRTGIVATAAKYGRSSNTIYRWTHSGKFNRKENE
jgi:hypothetical protein